MKKLLSLSVFILTLGLLTFVACKKEIVDTSTPQSEVSLSKTSEDIPVTYFYDKKPVVKGTFDPSKEEANTLVVLKLDESQRKYVEIHGFSSKEAYLSYGDEKFINLRLQSEIEEHLKSYAETSGATAEYERTGVESKSFMDYAHKYIASKKNTQGNFRSISFMYEDCFAGSGSSWGFIETSPTMLFGVWSDKVSAYQPIGLFSIDSFYDKTFYRKRLATFANFGWTVFTFCQPGLFFMDDKTSSWIRL
jgi:hypothetical protein